MNPTLKEIILFGGEKKANTILLNCDAGLMDFSITGGKNVLWTFPDGTTSTVSRPAKTIEKGIVSLYCSNWGDPTLQLNDNGTDSRFRGKLADFQGKLTYYLYLYNCTNITGSLADLQGKLTYYLGLYNCTNITGSLADLQGKLTYYLNLSNCTSITGSLADLQGKLTDYLNLSNCTNITGSLADLQGKLTYYLYLYNCTNITGSLADLQGKLTYHLGLYNCTSITGSLADLQGKLTYYLDLYNCTSITGSLADLQGKLTYYLDLSNCTNITGVYTPSGTGTPTFTILTGTGLSTADMDNTLIAYAGAITPKSNGTFTATGKTRSTASDAAVATLLGRGWTISGLVVV